MSHDSDHTDWPPEAGDPSALPIEQRPPEALEDRVVGTLLTRGLIHADQAPVARHIGFRTMRASLAVAACAALVAIGFLFGQQRSASDPPLSLTGAENDLYALLLYETDGYDRPSATEAMARYGEYSEWVAEAVRLGQFVTGEDLEVERGWMVVPNADGPAIEVATAIGADAPLSGIFFVRAQAPEAALELAQNLPHVKYGGRVLVQKTIPTDVPPTDSD